MLYRVFLEKDENGGYVVYCPALPGCFSQGENKEEALNNMREAIECHIESLKQRGLPVPTGEKVPEVEVLEVTT